MPGSTESSAMAPAAMTESPIAVTSRPGTLPGADESADLAAGPEAGRDACARVAAPARSPMMICFSMPDGAEGAWKTLHPAVQVTVTAAASRNTGRARAGERQAAAAEVPGARQTGRQGAGKPFRRMGSSGHFQDEAAKVITRKAVTASPASTRTPPGRGTRPLICLTL